MERHNLRQVRGFMKTGKMTHASLIEILVSFDFCFLADLKESFKNKETGQIKWDQQNEN